MRPIDEPMSHSEMEWWICYRSFVPCMTEQLKWMEARLIGLHAGKSPGAVYFDPFHEFHDPEWQDKEVDRLREINRKNREERKRRESENVKNS